MTVAISYKPAQGRNISHLCPAVWRPSHQLWAGAAAVRDRGVPVVPEPPVTQTRKEGLRTAPGAGGSCFVQSFTWEVKSRWMSTT